MDGTLRRRELAALALCAFTPGLAGQAFARSKSARISLSTSSATTTSTTTTTSTSSDSGYCSLSLDDSNRDSFADQLWNVQRDTSKLYPIQEAAGVLPVRHRFETRRGDKWNGETGRNRAEFACCARQAFGRDVWFSYAMRIKSGTPVSNWNILGQFHNTPDSGDDGSSPPFAINLLKGEKLRFLRRFDANAVTTSSPPVHIMHERSVVRDRWCRIVGRIVFGWENNGAVDLWFDGAKIVSLANTSIGYNDLKGPYWKFGIYRADVAETLVVDYANLELTSTSLLDRVTSPLPI